MGPQRRYTKLNIRVSDRSNNIQHIRTVIASSDKALCTLSGKDIFRVRASVYLKGVSGCEVLRGLDVRH